MSKFRVVWVLEPEDFPRHFTVHGGLKPQHKSPEQKCSSANEAFAQAWEWASEDWHAFIIRRHRKGGWVKVGEAAFKSLA